MSRYVGDPNLDRYVLPDVYPRHSDPGVEPGIMTPPSGTPAGGTLGTPGMDLYAGVITTPSVRPVVYQRAQNFTLAVTDSAQPITNATFACEAILVDVPSSSSNSAFFGYGTNITSSNGGIEVVPGIPLFFSPSNNREQWEIQRLLEAITAMLGAFVGQQINGGIPLPGPGTYMAPRVVMDAHNYCLVNAPTVAQNVSVMLFMVPEMQ